MAKLFLTDRALDDLADIHAYSVEQVGKRVADRYLEHFDSVFGLLCETPSLLKERDDCPGRLRFNRVQNHWVVCDRVKDRIFVLTVMHGAMDLPARLAELEPTLMREAEALRRRINRM